MTDQVTTGMAGVSSRPLQAPKQRSADVAVQENEHPNSEHQLKVKVPEVFIFYQMPMTDVLN